MKTIFTFILMLVVSMSFTISAQVEIIDVSRALNDLTAQTQKRVDLNGKICALIKVEMASPQAKFQGNIIGDVSFNTSEYLIYVSSGTKEIKIMHPEQSPLLIKFSEFGIDSLEGGYTYLVKLQLPSNIQIKDVDELLNEGKAKFFAKEYDEAIKIFTKAASYNSPDAMFFLSLLTKDEDKNESNYWCRRAAELGFPHAQYNMGVNYFEGDGVIKDMAEGVRWFEKAAAQGAPNAMYNLGIAYEFGYGVQENLDEAEYWYFKADENEMERASKALARVQEKIVSPESDFVDFNLFCVKANKTYCFSPSVWKSIPESKKKYYDNVGLFMNPENSDPFIYTKRDEDREITIKDARNKYGEYLLTLEQAEFIEKNTKNLIEACSAFNIDKPEGAYWVTSKKGDESKALFFIEDSAIFLLFAEGSVAAVRPIINITPE